MRISTRKATNSAATRRGAESGGLFEEQYEGEDTNRDDYVKVDENNLHQLISTKTDPTRPSTAPFSSRSARRCRNGNTSLPEQQRLLLQPQHRQRAEDSGRRTPTCDPPLRPRAGHGHGACCRPSAPSSIARRQRRQVAPRRQEQRRHCRLQHSSQIAAWPANGEAPTRPVCAFSTSACVAAAHALDQSAGVATRPPPAASRAEKRRA